jgi:hypothetical protein
MAGHSRPKDGVASARLCPAIHVFYCSQDVDARHKDGHDEFCREQQNAQICSLAGIFLASGMLGCNLFRSRPSFVSHHEYFE